VGRGRAPRAVSCGVLEVDVHARIARAPRVIGRRVHGRMVLVRLPALETQVLNEVGARVWELAEGRTIDDIAAVLASELEQPRAVIERDVHAFVATLARDAMLRVST
jgi:hypothetical protein